MLPVIFLAALVAQSTAGSFRKDHQLKPHHIFQSLTINRVETLSQDQSKNGTQIQQEVSFRQRISYQDTKPSDDTPPKDKPLNIHQKAPIKVRTKPVQRNTVTIAGFDFVTTATNEVGDVRLVARVGYFNLTQGVRHEPSWTFSSTNGVKSITQEMLIDEVLISYEDVKATYNDVTTEGKLLDFSRNTKLKMRIFAAPEDDGTCKLSLVVEFVETEPQLLFMDFGGVEDVLQEAEVLRALKAVVARTSGTALAEYYTKNLDQVLSYLLDMKTMCPELMEGTADNYPQPKF